MWCDKVKLIMEREGINQKELSRLSGITEASVSRYLSSGRTPRIDVIVNFAKALNVSVDELLSDNEHKKGLYEDLESRMLLARDGEKLTIEEQNKLIQLILSFKNE